MINLSPVAFALRKELTQHGITVSNGHALELIAAVLSYGTLAALRFDEQSASTPPLEDADHIILQEAAVERRTHQLSLPPSWAKLIFKALVGVLRAAPGLWQPHAQVHGSYADFEDYLAQDTQDRAWDDNDVVSAYAETNAAPDEFYTEVYQPSGNLFLEPESWAISLSGTHTGEQDPERTYMGDRGNFEATYQFDKAGRCGLIEVDFTIGVDFNRDGDYDD